MEICTQQARKNEKNTKKDKFNLADSFRRIKNMKYNPEKAITYSTSRSKVKGIYGQYPPDAYSEPPQISKMQSFCVII